MISIYVCSTWTLHYTIQTVGSNAITDGSMPTVFCLGCFWGVLHPLLHKCTPLSVFQRLLHPHKNDGMHAKPICINSNHYQTVIQMQVHSNGMQYNCWNSTYYRVLLWDYMSHEPYKKLGLRPLHPPTSKFWWEHCMPTPLTYVRTVYTHAHLSVVVICQGEVTVHFRLCRKQSQQGSICERWWGLRGVLQGKHLTHPCMHLVQ